MDVNFRIGECFTTYKDLEEKIKRFVRSSWSPLYIRESRKITCTRRAPNKVVNESLVYGDLRYCCIHGGRSGDAQNRKSTHQMACPFMMTLRADADGRYLRVTKAILEHNHPVSKEIYDQLPRRFRIRFDPDAQPSPTPSLRHKTKKNLKKIGRHPYYMKREEVIKAEQLIKPKQEKKDVEDDHCLLQSPLSDTVDMNNQELPAHVLPNNVLPSNLLPNLVQPNNLQPNNLQPNNLQPNSLQASNLQSNNIQLSHTQPNHMQLSQMQSNLNMQLNHAQPDHLQLNHIPTNNNNSMQPSHLQPNHLQPNHIMETISEAPRLPAPTSSATDCHNTWGDDLDGMLPPKKRRTSITNEDLHDTLLSQAQRHVEREKDSDEVRGALLSYLRQHNEQDEEDRFFLSMAAICKTLPADVRATLKFRIHHLIFDAQMDNLSQTTA